MAHFFSSSESVSIPEDAKGFIHSVNTEALGKNIYFVSCQYNPDSFIPDLHQYLNIPVEPSLQNAVLKRRAEFLAGRYVACVALEFLDIKPFTIYIGKYRQPVWPPGIVGSISHSNTHAVSIVSSSLCYVGVDIEPLLVYEQATEISNSIASVEEYRRLSDKGISFQFAVVLLFSAKESLFKAIFPKVGRYLDFFSSELIDIDTEKNKLKLKLNKELQVETGFNHYFECYFFTVDSDYVLTLVYGTS